MNYEILNSNIGKSTETNSIVLRGTCPFCTSKSTFRQVAENSESSSYRGSMIALQCEGCNAIVSYCLDKEIMYPSPKLEGVKDLPESIAKYYNEALDCLSANAPNGAVTMFRKVIHALGIHYNVAKVNDNANLYAIINKLQADGHIVPKIRDALLSVKDIGNDGAHVNDNEPDMEQALCLKELIDVTLMSTVNCDQAIEFAQNKHKCSS